MALTEQERAVLELERCWWQLPGPKGAAIRERVGLSPTRYYEVLASLVESSEALAHDPLVVLRVRRARHRRRRTRFEGPADTGRRPAR
jgi:hypothetical protein